MFCVKKTFLTKNAWFSKKKMSQTKKFLGVNPRPKYVKAQLRLLEKQHHQKKVIALNLYIGTNVLVYERWLVLKVWYTATRPAQRFRHYIDSHCLCMWRCESIKITIKYLKGAYIYNWQTQPNHWNSIIARVVKMTLLFTP